MSEELVELGWRILLVLYVVISLGTMITLWVILRSLSWKPPQKVRMPDHSDVTNAVTHIISNGMWRSSEGGRT